ncbi:hypothetical protein NMY22_g4801 [Coprinellus aureogranulatus]|nr:hypothetical protein NMY22_g4801 [Coprinellus aureogranulatus]
MQGLAGRCVLGTQALANDEAGSTHKVSFIANGVSSIGMQSCKSAPEDAAHNIHTMRLLCLRSTRLLSSQVHWAREMSTLQARPSRDPSQHFAGQSLRYMPHAGVLRTAILEYIHSFSLLWDVWEEEWRNPGYRTLAFLPRGLRTFRLDLPVYGMLPERALSSLEVTLPPSLLNRLTSFQLKCDWALDIAFKFLRHCSNLKDLTINYVRAEPGWISLQDPAIQEIRTRGLVLPALETLHIDQCTGDYFEFLMHLKMPVLTGFSVFLGYDGWWPGIAEMAICDVDSATGTDFGAFLRGDTKTPPTLQSLRITNGNFGNDALYNALQHLSSIEHLEMDNAVFSHDTFTKLASQKALPQLRRLTLLRLHTDPANISGLQALAEKGGVELKTSRCKSTQCGICAR